MTRCGGCDNKLWCRCCAQEYMSSKAALEQEISNARQTILDGERELNTTEWDEKGEPK